jgi:Ca2+-binding RTX toxin-like protein
MRGQTIGAIVAATMSAMLAFVAVAFAETIKGTQGDDAGATALVGTSLDDRIIAKKGNDEAFGLGGQRQRQRQQGQRHA